jgi:predicted N-acetyltransferase YhbS
MNRVSPLNLRLFTDHRGYIYRRANAVAESGKVPRDFEEVMNLFNENFEHPSFEFLPPSAKTPITEARVRKEWMGSNRAHVHWVVHDEIGNMIASAHIGPFQTGGESVRRHLSVIVHPSHHSQGVGTRLCQVVFEEALANGGEISVVTGKRHHAMQRILQTLGSRFRVETDLEFNGVGRVRFLVMQQELGQL